MPRDISNPIRCGFVAASDVLTTMSIVSGNPPRLIKAREQSLLAARTAGWRIGAVIAMTGSGILLLPGFASLAFIYRRRGHEIRERSRRTVARVATPDRSAMQPYPRHPGRLLCREKALAAACGANCTRPIGIHTFTAMLRRHRHAS